MKSLHLPLLVAAAGVPAQTFLVTTPNDSGSGSLRNALLAANAYGTGAEVRITATATTGALRLSSRLPLLLADGLTIVADAGAGRFSIDASGVTGTAGVGLELQGRGIRLLAPLRLVVGSSFGIGIRNGPAEAADLVVQGGVGAGRGSQGVLLDSADDVTLHALDVNGFQSGIMVLDSQRARIATGSTDGPIRLAACANAITLLRGADHAVGSLTCTGCDVGVFADQSTGIRLGTAAGPRSQIDGCSWHGVELNRAHDTEVSNLTVQRCGTGNGYGIYASACDRLRMQAVAIDGCLRGGVALAGGCRLPWLQGVNTGATLARSDIGVDLSGADGATLLDCTIGPGHDRGVAVGLGSVALTEITLARCVIGGNLQAGVTLGRATRVLLHGCTVVGNVGFGIHAAGTSLANGPADVTVAECRIADNPGYGLLCQFAQRVKIGPGNTLADNRNTAVFVDGCVDVEIAGNPLLQGNRGSGIEIIRTPGTRVTDTLLRGHPGLGLVVQESPGTRVGPGVVIEDSGGTGMRLDNCEDVTVVSSRIVRGASTGIHLVHSDSIVRTRPNLLQSCLVAGQGGLGVYFESGAPTRCELSTITGNLRGVHSQDNPLDVDSCIVWGNALEDLHRIATATTIRDTIHATPPPNAANGNTAADPRFVAAPSGDWRLQAGSPAIDSGNQGLNLPSGAVDAFDGPRRVGALDRGAYEFGPHVPDDSTKLILTRSTMAPGGGGLSLRCRYPSAAVGGYSVLLMQVGPPSGSFQAFGATVPLAPTSFLMFAASDGRSIGTIAVVPQDGIVRASLLWAGLVPPQLLGTSFSLCAVALDATPRIRAVSNPVTFSVN